MKLQKLQWHAREHRLDLGRGGVDEQADGSDEGWQQGHELGRLLDGNRARAGRIEHKAERIGTALDGHTHVLRAGQTADLDSGTGHSDKGELRERDDTPIVGERPARWVADTAQIKTVR